MQYKFYIYQMGNFSVFYRLFCLLMLNALVAFPASAPAIDIVEAAQTLSIDPSALDQFNERDIRMAFRKTMFINLKAGHGVEGFNADLAVEARDVLLSRLKSEPTPKEIPIDLARDSFLRDSLVGRLVVLFPELGTLKSESRSYGSGVTYSFPGGTYSFNTGHLRNTVEDYRTGRRSNPAQEAFELHASQGTPKTLLGFFGSTSGSPTYEKSQLDGLSIETLISQLSDDSSSIQNDKSEQHKKYEAFLDHWVKDFSSKNPDGMTFERFVNVFRSNPLWYEIFLISSMKNSSWPLHTVIEAGLEQLESSNRIRFTNQFAIQLAAEPIFENHPDLVDRFLAAKPEGAATFMTHALHSERALAQSQWFFPFLSNPTKAKLFLHEAIWVPAVLEVAPHLITQALFTLAINGVGARDTLATDLLANPRSAAHPEWLEILIKTDRYDFMILPLNGVLALEHWFKHPYLRHILKGEKLTVENLRRVAWTPPDSGDIELLPVSPKRIAAPASRIKDSRPGALLCDRIYPK